MFLSSFQFNKINSIKKSIGDYKFIEHNYSFRGKSNKRYLVIVEEYQYSIFIVKFCLQERKIYSDRFNHLTKLNECSRVFTTIGEIIKKIHNDNPFASFGFIGSNLPGENKINTKRFRIYRKIVTQVISPVHFEHRESPNNSAYLLLNRDSNYPDLFEKAIEMFQNIYLEITNPLTSPPSPHPTQ